MAAKNPRCDTCEYWEGRKRQVETKLHKDDREGTCKLYPPALNAALVYFVVIDADEEEGAERDSESRSDEALSLGRESYTYRQPETTGADWCGQWRFADPNRKEPQ